MSAKDSNGITAESRWTCHVDTQPPELKVSWDKEKAIAVGSTVLAGLWKDATECVLSVNGEPVAPEKILRVVPGTCSSLWARRTTASS